MLLAGGASPRKVIGDLSSLQMRMILSDQHKQQQQQDSVRSYYVVRPNEPREGYEMPLTGAYNSSPQVTNPRSRYYNTQSDGL